MWIVPTALVLMFIACVWGIYTQMSEGKPTPVADAKDAADAVAETATDAKEAVVEKFSDRD